MILIGITSTTSITGMISRIRNLQTSCYSAIMTVDKTGMGIRVERTLKF